MNKSISLGILFLAIFFRVLRNQKDGMKISRLGIILLFVHTIYILFASHTSQLFKLRHSSLGGEAYFVFFFLTFLDLPVVLVLAGLSMIINQLQGVGLLFSLIEEKLSVNLVIFYLFLGGMQWYFIGWLFSKLTNRAFLQRRG